MKVKAIIHGRSGLRDVLTNELTAFFELKEVSVQILLTTQKGDAEEWSAQADADLVIACGGDGTNNEVINGLMRIEANARPAFAFLAAGSGNDLARTLGEQSLETIWSNFESGNGKRIDTLRIQCAQEIRFAINMSTFGIGAEIANTVNQRKFKVPPALNYYTAILQWLSKYKAPTIRFTLDEKPEEMTVFLAAFGNGKYAGNGLGLCPQADPFDGKLALTLIGNVGVLDFLRYQGKLKRCLKINDPRVHYRQCRALELEVVEGKLTIETDGEFFVEINKGGRCRISILEDELLFV